MKILLLGLVFLLTACGSHDSDGPSLSSLNAQQTAALHQISSIAETKHGTLDSNHALPANQSFAQVKTNMAQLLACGPGDQIAYSRPTRTSFISDGFSKALLVLDKVNLLAEEEVRLTNEAPVRRVFAQVHQDDAHVTGKLALALLVLPEDYLLQEKANDLAEGGYWTHYALALMAFQCVDTWGNPAAKILKVSDRYLTLREGKQVELGQTKDGQFKFNAENGAFLLKSRLAGLPAASNVALSTVTEEIGQNRDYQAARWLKVYTTNTDLDRLVDRWQTQLRQEDQAFQEKIAASEKNRAGYQKSIDELNQPDRKSVLNRPAAFIYRLMANHYGSNARSMNTLDEQKFSVLETELSLLGDY